MPVKAVSFCLLCSPFPMADATGDTARTADGADLRTDQRDTPQHLTQFSAIKAWEKENGGNICGSGACLPELPLCLLRPCFLGSGYTPAWLIRSSKLIPTLLCCVPTTSVSPVKLSHSLSLLFISLFPCLICWLESTQCSGVLQNLLENSEFGGLQHFLNKDSLYPVMV